MSEDPYKLNQETYNSLAKQYEEKFMNWDGYHKTYDVFLKYIDGQNANVLEIGCGPGNVSNYLLKKKSDLNVLGIDIAPNMIQRARQNNPTATYQVMDCRNIRKLNQSFDAIMCGFCTPYIKKEDVEKLIEDAAVLLKKNGLFYLSTMEGDYKTSSIQTSPNHSHKVHIFYYEAGFLKEILERNGFEILQEIRQVYKEKHHSEAVDLFLLANKM